MSKELSDLSVDVSSDCLKGRKIGLCVCGGIAAIVVPLVVRELRRFGASVKCLATPHALSFVGESALEWATAQNIEKDFTGLAPHICTSDALLVMPATANTLVKAHLGICDDLVSTRIQSAFGQEKMVLFFPSMHMSLAKSPALLKAIEHLKTLKNVFIFWGPSEEGKLKTLDAKSIAQISSHYLNKFFLSNRLRILLTTGGTTVPWDDIRMIANKSTGHLGFLTAGELYRWGHQLTVLQGYTLHPLAPIEGLTVFSCPEFTPMSVLFKESIEKEPDALIHMAAVSDFQIQNTFSGKFSSHEFPPPFQWIKTEKLMDFSGCEKVKFKVACKLTKEEGEKGWEKARRLLIDKHLNAVVWNSIEGAFHSESHEAKILTNFEDTFHRGKNEIVSKISTLVQEYFE